MQTGGHLRAPAGTLPFRRVLSRDPPRASVLSAPARWLLCAVLLGAGLAGGLAHPAAAQRATLRGFVTDAADGQTLPGVNVVLQDAAGALTGMATNTNGFYLLSGLAPGRYRLRVTFLGYAPYVDTLTLAPGLRHLDFALRESSLELRETTVESERVTGAASVTAGFQRIRAEDLALVPSPDVSGDLASYLTTLPGVVTTGDQGGQLFIRGGEPTQNLVLLDGIPVAQPFHLLGFYSAFPADLLASADLYAGGYGARYGGRLSSVLDVTSRTGNLERLEASASASPLVVSAIAEGPLQKGTTSLLVSGRQSVLGQVAAKLVPGVPALSFGDLFGRLHYAPNTAGRFSATGLYTHDAGALGAADSPRPDQVRYTNAGIGGRYLYLPRHLPFLAEALVSVAELRASVGPRADAPVSDDTPTRQARLTLVQTEANVTYALGKTSLRGGGFLHFTETESQLGGLFENVDAKRRNEAALGLYAEPDLVLGRHLRFTPGVRLTFLMALKEVYAEPRLRAVFSWGVHRLSAAGGMYTQPLAAVSDRRDATSVFTAYTITPDARTPRALPPRRRLRRPAAPVARPRRRRLRQRPSRTVGGGVVGGA